VIIPNFTAAREVSNRIQGSKWAVGKDLAQLSAGKLNAMGLIDEILHMVLGLYREKVSPRFLDVISKALHDQLGSKEFNNLLYGFTDDFPPPEVFQGLATAGDWLSSSSVLPKSGRKIPNSKITLEELILLKLANENTAFGNFRFLFDDGARQDTPEIGSLAAKTKYDEAFRILEKVCASLPLFGPEGKAVNLIELLRMPAKASPDSLEGQLLWIKRHWGTVLEGIDLSILKGLDLIKEETMPRFPPGKAAPQAYRYHSTRHEYEKFSPDQDWMPSLVLIAKNVLVWMHQLSVTYSRHIDRLDAIPDEELDTISERGINGLWLIGLWQRSGASERIKKMCGNPEAAASAYSLFDYEIAPELGGWNALDSLRERCKQRGIRLAADMVPNHTGIDSQWVRTRPELFIGTDQCPFPSYTFNGPDLSDDPSIGIWLEDHYYTRSDAAVVFKRMDRRSGKIRYLYHGNDGTGMAWNDTAQIDFLNPEAREAVKERILHLASHFNIIRFDAAMVLAKQHIRRLWYPSPGSGGAIPSRSEHAMSDEAFDRAMPHEFWREVVDLCAQKAPDTLLLAEAFWMMEGYFVRTLGMHRVYNSAFMNMLKEEKNSLFRLTIKNTQEFDKQILKRFVNFMSNPDEETALAQFGSGDKYFGICTMMATLPGLPMFGHGQIEGFSEKYGMEYRRSYKDETPNLGFIERHEREIFPLLRTRRSFSGVDHFCLFDFERNDGRVDENVFAYSNGEGDTRTLVFYNNFWQRTSGRITLSCPFAAKGMDGSMRTLTLSVAAALDLDPRPGNFIVARDARSGLLHLHRCADLLEQGWRIDLEGYESRVFVDLERVHDFDGRYEALYESIQGKGIADLDDALEEASNPELYHALSVYLDSIQGIWERMTVNSKPTEIAPAVEETANAAEVYFGRLAKAIADGEEPRPGIDDVLRARATMEHGLRFLGTLSELNERMAEPGTEAAKAIGDIVSAMRSGNAVQSLLYFVFIKSLTMIKPYGNPSEELRFILAKFLVQKKMLSSAIAYPYLESSEDAHALDKIGRDTVCELIFAFATRPARPTQRSSKSDFRARALELLRWARQDMDAKHALGINAWNGIEYYNKERMDALLSMAPLFALLEDEMDQPAKRPRIAEVRKGQASIHLGRRALSAWKVAELIEKAGQDSGFQVERLALNLDNRKP
jgi:hypothetical protein